MEIKVGSLWQLKNSRFKEVYRVIAIHGNYYDLVNIDDTEDFFEEYVNWFALNDEVMSAYDEYMDGLSPAEDISDTAIDWFMAVRKFGIDKANEMFPS